MLFLIPAISFGQRTANLTGKIYSIPVNTVIHISSNRGFKDSVFTKDGTFRFDIPCDSVWDAYFIQFPDSLSTFSFPVLLKESSQISLKLNTKAQQYEISGDKNAEEQNDFWQGLVSLNTCCWIFGRAGVRLVEKTLPLYVGFIINIKGTA